ncbi:MAG: diguanylate cyclase [Pseudomonadota bacterium]
MTSVNVKENDYAHDFAPKSKALFMSDDAELHAFDVLQDGILMVSDPGKNAVISYANPSALTLLDRTLNKIIGHPVRDVFQASHRADAGDADGAGKPDVGKRAEELIFAVRDGGLPKNLTFQTRQGPHQISLECQFMERGTGVLIALRNITALAAQARHHKQQLSTLINRTRDLQTERSHMQAELEKLRIQSRELERMVPFDRASGLPNRAHFMDLAAAEFQRSRRYGHCLSVVMAKILGYDTIIRSQGADCGDAVLMGIAQVCDTACRSGVDIVGRYSDSVFALVLPETNVSGALIFEDRLRTIAARMPIATPRGRIKLGLRTGIVGVQDEDRAILDSLNRAETAMLSRGEPTAE